MDGRTVTEAGKGAGGPDAGEPEGGGRRSPRRRGLDRSLGSRALPERVACPFCGGEETEQFAAFGSALSSSQYYCHPCRTVFEFMKRRRTEALEADPADGDGEP